MKKLAIVIALALAGCCSHAEDAPSWRNDTIVNVACIDGSLWKDVAVQVWASDTYRLRRSGKRVAHERHLGFCGGSRRWTT
jgi:hypothetical protein